MEDLSPKLKIVKTRNIAFHEEADPKRSKRLRHKIKKDGIFINPPIVVQEGQKYVLLDGANRVNSMRALGYQDVLVQIVDYAAVKLGAWQHLVCTLNQAKFKKQVSDLARRRGNHLKLEKITANIENLPKDFLTWIVFGSEAYKIKKQSSFLQNLLFLNDLVKLYKGQTLVYRIDTRIGINKARNNYKNFTALIKFCTFTPRDVLRAAKSDIKLPSGITRHILPVRALKVNLPLSLLKREEALKLKNQKLRQLLKNKAANNQARLYEESVWIFDE